MRLKPRAEKALRPRTKKWNGPKGERNGSATLTEKEIRAMREMYSTGTKQVAIASFFGITQGHVSQIVTGKRWKHVPQS